MQYRNFGNLNIKPSLLGFGAMRMPFKNGITGDIDEEKAIEMIRTGIDSGINYVDTAFPYHDGNSEFVVGKALKDGYRQKVYLATKNPVWLLEKPGDWTKYLDQQLEKLDVDSIDLYLQHAFDKSRFENFKKLHCYEEALKAKEDGKIKHIGFSFHDSYDVFEEIINEYPWDFCQIQLNYLDEEYQAGMKGLKLAASKNMGVVVMEPLRGGRLGDKMPEDVKDEFEKAIPDKSNVEIAFRWLANLPEVGLFLSGMSSLEQVKDNIRICSMEDMVPEKAITEKEVAAIKKIADQWNKRTLVGCTACNYCMPCPAGVHIPQSFSAYNVFGSSVPSAEMKAKKQYKEIVDEGGSAAQCVACGQCESACPQGIKIIDNLEKLHQVLS